MASRIYMVVGRTPNDPDVLPEMGFRLMAHGIATTMTRQRHAVILSVGLYSEEDYRVLSARFGGDYDHYQILNDAAVEACKAVNFQMKPLGAIAFS